jgi:hypothetical protein
VYGLQSSQILLIIYCCVHGRYFPHASFRRQRYAPSRWLQRRRQDCAKGGISPCTRDFDRMVTVHGVRAVYTGRVLTESRGLDFMVACAATNP